MLDMEKVIKELECCVSLSHNGSKCANCDYADEFHNGDCETYLLRDALALLKAQEPVEPKIVDTSNSKLYHNDMFKNHYCGNCGEFLHVVNRKDMFCSQCGKAVKWE
jgi:hypothetical protein